MTGRAILLAGALGLLASAAHAADKFAASTTMTVNSTAQNSTGGKITNFDDSWFNPITGDYYLADRSNASIDLFSTTTHTEIGSFGGAINGSKVFVGVGATSDTSGPNGVTTGVVDGTTYVFASDGNDTVKVFNATTAALVSNIPLGPSSDQRADTLAFNPTAGTLLVASPAATSTGAPYVTLINAASNAATGNPVISRVVLNGQNGTPAALGGGIEQPVYYYGKFYVAIPQNGTTGPGGVAAFDAKTGAFLNYTDLSTLGITSCGPSGLTISSGGQFLLGCNTNTSAQVVVTPTVSGGITSAKLVKGIGGADQVAFDAATNEFLVAGSGNSTGPTLGVIDAATDTLVQTISTVTGAHSVAADAAGDIYVPFGAAAGNTTCRNGCVEVFAPLTPVSAAPEPSTWALMIAAVGLMGAALRRGLRPALADMDA